MTWSEISFSLRNLPVRAFDSRAQGFSPPLARQRSSCPPPSPNLVRTHLIENHQALRDSAPCLSRAATLPKATKLELGRGAHLKTPSSANHTAAASQPTGRIAKAASWLHLSRVSPALLPPERPSHTHTPKPGFGGRGHEIVKMNKLFAVLHVVRTHVACFTSCCCCCLHIKSRSGLYSVLSNIRTGPTDADAFRGHRLTTQKGYTYQKEIKGPRKVNTHAIIGK